MARINIRCGRIKSAKKNHLPTPKPGVGKKSKFIKHGGSAAAFKSCFSKPTTNHSDPGYETPQIIVIAIKKRLNALNWMERAVVER
jgi:hypothetical protein